MNARNDARAKYHTFFTDLRGCRNGHIPAKRYVSTGNCTQCHSERYARQSKKADADLKLVMVPGEMQDVFYSTMKALGLDVVTKSARGDVLYSVYDHDAAQRTQLELRFPNAAHANKS